MKLPLLVTRDGVRIDRPRVMGGSQSGSAGQPRPRPRIGIVIEKTPSLPLGGSEAVGFWTVEALKDEHEVVIITADGALSLDEVNAFFGTHIHPNDVEIVVAPVPRRVKEAPRLRLLTKHLIARYCKQIAEDFDLLISTASEMDLGVKGIQYIHYPLVLSRRRSLLHAAYSVLSDSVSAYSRRRMALNWTLTNSRWTADRTKDAYGIDAWVVYPPVTDDLPIIPWGDREDGFVCVGRISPEKNLEGVIRILRDVRREIPDVHLHVIGEIHNRRYWERIAALLERERAWVFVEGRLPKDEMVRLVTAHKYGIHGMQEEHFGIGIAEMAKAGCLVFVPRGGGQLEIVQADDLIYDSERDAVTKIGHVLKETDRQARLQAGLTARAQGFSSRRFMEDMRAIVARFLAASAVQRPPGGGSA